MPNEPPPFDGISGPAPKRRPDDPEVAELTSAAGGSRARRPSRLIGARGPPKSCSLPPGFSTAALLGAECGAVGQYGEACAPGTSVVIFDWDDTLVRLNAVLLCFYPRV